MQLNFLPPGPVGAAFMSSRLPVKFIMGPVGSGKTSCMIIDTIYEAARQPQSKLDGVRYSKVLFVRETYRQLYATTIPSWWKWFPKKMGEWRGGGSDPAEHHLRWQLPDGSIVDLIARFEALGDNNDIEAFYRGNEFNLLRLNEADTLAGDVFDQGILRLTQGRYPGEMHVDPAAAVWSVCGDYNAPDIENWLYKLMEENRPADYGFFRQPSGFSPKAENRERASLESYEKMRSALLARGRADLVRRMIENEYGFTRQGSPVYAEEYRDQVHCAMTELMPAPDVVVRVDFDQGLRPACLLRQYMPSGQLRILDELYSEKGAQGICADLKRLLASPKYHGVTVWGGRADPAAAAADANDAEPWIDCVNRLMGWVGHQRLRVADTNAISHRHAAVRLRLKTNVEGGQPGLFISSTCKVLRKGFGATYRFKQKRGAGEADYADEPEKKFPVADVHDAAQYGALDEGGYEEVIGREKREQQNRRGRDAHAGQRGSFNVWGA